MNTEEKMILQGFKISIEELGLAMLQLKSEFAATKTTADIPEWVNLKTAVKLKGGGSLATYQSKLFLQPCCGLNYKLVAGRKCWHREQIIKWLAIDDSALKAYAEEWRVTLPDIYKKRSVAA